LALAPLLLEPAAKYGRVLDAARVWARASQLFLGVALLYGPIDRHEDFARYRRARPDELKSPAMAAWLTSNNLRQTRCGSMFIPRWGQWRAMISTREDTPN